MTRIVIIGTSGSGKTTLARRLSELLACPHVELDALHWGPNWTEADLEVFRARVAKAVSGERWVVDGNYGKARDLIWPRADTIVWLDYSLPRTLWQVTRRTFRRLRTREELWAGNRENWRMTFLSRESILLWTLQTHARRRRGFPKVMREPGHSHLQVVTIRSPKALEEWLETLNRVR